MPVRYEDDFFTWTQEQAAFLKAGQYDQLDIEHLVDEVESMGKSEIREFALRAALMYAHLLKLEYQVERTDKHERSWKSTVRTQRRQLRRHLEANPGLKDPAITARALDTGWNDRRDLAVRETEIDPDIFPEECLYSFEQIARNGFWSSKKKTYEGRQAWCYDPDGYCSFPWEDLRYEAIEPKLGSCRW